MNLLFEVKDKKEQHIGLWVQRHLRYLKHHRKVLYYNLPTSGKLNDYLSDIDMQAEEMYSQQVKQMTEREGVSKQLKTDNPMQWVGRL